MAPKRDPRDAEIGKRIRDARARIRMANGDELSQAELGRLIGGEDSSATTIWRYESGASPIPLRKLEKVADVLGVSVDYLLGRKPPTKHASKQTASADALRIAALGLQAAQEGTPEAIDRFNAALLEHAHAIEGTDP